MSDSETLINPLAFQNDPKSDSSSSSCLLSHHRDCVLVDSTAPHRFSVNWRNPGRAETSALVRQMDDSLWKQIPKGDPRRGCRVTDNRLDPMGANRRSRDEARSDPSRVVQFLLSCVSTNPGEFPAPGPLQQTHLTGTAIPSDPVVTCGSTCAAPDGLMPGSQLFSIDQSRRCNGE
jgi:hypothetical protein